jgi:hypothetical protein
MNEDNFTIPPSLPEEVPEPEFLFKIGGFSSMLDEI